MSDLYLDELTRLAEAQSAAHARMIELNGGIGLLGVRHPEMFEDMKVWSEATGNDHADTVLALVERVRQVEGEVEWEYAHEYTDAGGGKHSRKVSASEYAERKPDGHRADGSPYWNYEQKRRRKAGPWEVAP